MLHQIKNTTQKSNYSQLNQQIANKLVKGKSQKMSPQTKTYTSPTLFQQITTTKQIAIPASNIKSIKTKPLVQIFNSSNQPVSNPQNNKNYMCQIILKTGSIKNKNVSYTGINVPFQISFSKSHKTNISINLLSTIVTVTCPSYLAKYAGSILQSKVKTINNTLVNLATVKHSVQKILTGKYPLVIFGQQMPIKFSNGPLSVQFHKNYVSISHNNSCSYLHIAHAIKMAYTKMLNKNYMYSAKKAIAANKNMHGFNVVVKSSGNQYFTPASVQNNKTLCVSSMYAVRPVHVLNYALYYNIVSTIYNLIVPQKTLNFLQNYCTKAFNLYHPVVNNKLNSKSIQLISNLYAV